MLVCPAYLFTEEGGGRGKIYLLATMSTVWKPSAALSFNVGQEVISTVALPPGEDCGGVLFVFFDGSTECMCDQLGVFEAIL
jgi:hypothetical protein